MEIVGSERTVCAAALRREAGRRVDEGQPRRRLMGSFVEVVIPVIAGVGRDGAIYERYGTEGKAFQILP